jgi:parallel beta-helix repeat protein
MPDLPQEGHSTRVFNNRVNGNNTGNFAPPGGAVAGVPAGSGVIINSNDKVEIFENEISDNKTANVLISSFFSASYSARETAPTFDPFPETIYIYDNAFSGGGEAPDREELEALRAAMFAESGRLPDVVWDGIANPEKTDPAFAICVNNGEAVVLNVDAGNNYQNVSVDMSGHSCDHEKLSEIVLSAGG